MPERSEAYKRFPLSQIKRKKKKKKREIRKYKSSGNFDFNAPESYEGERCVFSMENNENALRGRASNSFLRHFPCGLTSSFFIFFLPDCELVLPSKQDSCSIIQLLLQYLVVPKNMFCLGGQFKTLFSTLSRRFHTVSKGDNFNFYNF